MISIDFNKDKGKFHIGWKSYLGKALYWLIVFPFIYNYNSILLKLC